MRSSVRLFATAAPAVTVAGAAWEGSSQTFTKTRAAKDLYGANSTPDNTVAAAWSAVSVS